jgi:hypothetical protein
MLHVHDEDMQMVENLLLVYEVLQIVDFDEN